jgi:hypothetical protein
MADVQDGLIQKKVQLLKTGLYGFIGCLVLCFFSLVLQVVISLWHLILQVEDAGAWLANLGIAFFPVFFAGAFVSFGIIIASAVKEPRNVDMGEHMKSSAGPIASFFITGILLDVVPLLASMAAFFGAVYYRGESVIFLALCYFVISMAVFFAAVGYAIVRSVGGAAEPGPDAPVMKRLFNALRPGALSDRSRRVLTRIERVLGSALGTVLFLLFSSRGLYDAVRSKTGHGSDTTWLDLLVSTDAVLAFFSLFIFIFSTLFIIKAVKTAFDKKPGSIETPPDLTSTGLS